MTWIVVNDASCLIDLRKGQLLHVLLKLPYHFTVPFPIRESELLDFTAQEWRILDGGGMETFDLPPDQISQAHMLKGEHSRLSANDCFCLVTTQCHEDSMLLTGDGLLRRVAASLHIPVHGVLWVVDELKTGGFCEDALLINALETWRADRSVFLPASEIEKRLRKLR